MLVEKEGVKERQAECFEGLLNVKVDIEAEIVVFGKKNGVKVLRGTDHERESARGGKRGESKKSFRIGWVWCRMSEKQQYKCEWLVRLSNVYFVTSMVPVDWAKARVVPLYKGKGDKYDCTYQFQELVL